MCDWCEILVALWLEWTGSTLVGVEDVELGLLLDLDHLASVFRAVL